MSNDTNYESKAITTQIRATSRASVKVFSVYAHISPNNKLYFGITSLKPEYRWYSDGSGYKHQVLFYRAIQKYGWNNFEHIIVAKNLSQSQACKMEQDLISMFHSNNPKFGYNNTNGGDGIHGYHHTEKAKKRISRSVIKRKAYLNMLKNPCDKRKKCALVDKQGNIVYSYNSLSECAKALDLSTGLISKKLKTNGTYGYLRFVEVK